MNRLVVAVAGALLLGACVTTYVDPSSDAGAGGGSAAVGGGAASVGGGDVGGGSVGGGGETIDAGPIDSGTVDAGPARCQIADAGYPQPTGTTRTLGSNQTIKAAIMASAAGDRLLIPAGQYPAPNISSTFASDVFIEPVPGAVVQLNGMTLNAASHLVFRGITFDSTVSLIGCSNIRFDGITITLAGNDASGLELNGQQSAGANSNITVVRSKLSGGGRTVFVLGKFAPSTTWNHDLLFTQNDFTCGTHNCFQLSGARDMLIDDNYFHDPRGDGILTAGATRITISRNRMRGDRTVVVSAVRLATPGKEWDNYAGVENMISSDITVANNLIAFWGGSGIELDAAKDIRIVYNTVVESVGFKTWARVPHAQNNDVILTGNTNVTLWNNLLTNTQIDSADPMPTFTTNLISTTTMFQDIVDYAPVSPGPAIGTATVNADTPLVDRRGGFRGAHPDIGAVQVDALPCQ